MYLTTTALRRGAPLMTARFAAAQRVLRRKRKAVAHRHRASRSPGAPSLVDIAASRPPLDAPSNHPRSARALRRFVWRVLQSHDDYERYVRVQMATGIEEAHADTDRLNKKLRELTQKVREHGQWFQQSEGDTVESLASLVARLESQQGRLEVLESRMADIGEPDRWSRIDAAVRAAEELHAIPYMSDPALLRTVTDEGDPAIGYRTGGELGEGFASFEEVFRGPEQMIRERFRQLPSHPQRARSRH